MALRIVDRWLATRFCWAYLAFAFAVVLLYLTIDVFANLGSFQKRGDLLEGLLERYGSRVPELFYTLSPHLVVLAGLWTIIGLLRSNELVPLLAAGYSTRRLTAPLLAAAGVLAVLTWVDREHVLPRLAAVRRADRLKVRESLRPIPDGQGGVLSARYYFPAEQALDDPRFVRCDERGRAVEHVFARRATPEGEGWRFVDGVVITRRGGEDEVRRVGPEGRLVAGGILLSDVEAAIVAPTYLSTDQLRAQLSRPGFRHLEVQLYERYAQPFAGLILLLIACPLAFAAARGEGLYLRVLLCIAASIGYFLTATTCYELGTRVVLGPVAAAFLPPALFGGLGLCLFLRSEV